MFLLVGLIACADPAPVTSTATAPTALNARTDMDIDAFAALVKSGGVDLLDVRTPEEFATGHVPGAKNLPINEIDLVNPLLANHPKDKPLYVICAVGGRSLKASDQLASAGYQTVNVLGGTSAWRDKGLPLE